MGELERLSSRVCAPCPIGTFSHSSVPISLQRCEPCPHGTFASAGGMSACRPCPDGSFRAFRPGDHFFSADTLPPGATFDPAVHGHWSRQVGDEPLVTLFVRG